MSFPHLKILGEVTKPLSAETSEIFKSRPKFRIGPRKPKFTSTIEKCQFCNFR